MLEATTVEVRLSQRCCIAPVSLVYLALVIALSKPRFRPFHKTRARVFHRIESERQSIFAKKATTI